MLSLEEGLAHAAHEFVLLGGRAVYDLLARLLDLAGELRDGELEPMGLVGLLAVCTAFLIDGSFNPFLYFRF